MILQLMLSFNIEFWSPKMKNNSTKHFFTLGKATTEVVHFVNYDSFQGSYLFSETSFQHFSRTQIDFSRALKFT